MCIIPRNSFFNMELLQEAKSNTILKHIKNTKTMISGEELQLLLWNCRMSIFCCMSLSSPLSLSVYWGQCNTISESVTPLVYTNALCESITHLSLESASTHKGNYTCKVRVCMCVCVCMYEICTTTSKTIQTRTHWKTQQTISGGLHQVQLHASFVFYCPLHFPQQ